jgi:hypothetical protein
MLQNIDRFLSQTLKAFRYLVGCEDVGYCEDARVSCADCSCVPSADVGFERFRSAVNVVAAATCADLPATVEDDPGFIVFSKPESWWLGFAARHDGLTNLRMARGVVRSLPATLAISRVPAAAALRNDDNVNGPSGKKGSSLGQGHYFVLAPFGGVGACFRSSELVGFTPWHAMQIF